MEQVGVRKKVKSAYPPANQFGQEVQSELKLWNFF
jgi:hypothetical protein